MAEFAAFPLWLDAYLLDTQELKTVEHGAYLLILFAMWRAGGFLPNNDAKLARCARLPLAKWMAMKPTMMEFLSVDGEQITQGRLQDELEKARARSAKAAQSARAKYRKTNTPTPANAPPKDSSASASISASVSSKESSLRSESRSRLKIGEIELRETLDPEHALAVVDHRLRIKKPLSAHAAKLLAGKFGRCPDPNVAADAMIGNGWQGFEPEWLDRPARSSNQSNRQPTAADVGRMFIERENDREREDARRTDHQAPRQLAAPPLR